jgi:GNAT superfamily N-acetyltransferase
MPRLTDAQAAYLCDVDHHDHEALIALDDATGEGVGVARYVRDPGTDVAEAAVTVIDDWQGRGLGTALLDRIAARAREEGVRRFTALMLSANRDMLDLLETLGTTEVVAHDGATVEVVVDLPEEGVPAQMREMLRQAAAGSVRVVNRVAGALARAAGEEDRDSS